MGVNVVLQLLTLHGMHVADGLVLLDDSPKSMALSGGVLVDASFPSELTTFSPYALQQWLQRSLSYDASVEVAGDWENMNLTQLKGRWQPYFEVGNVMLDQFHPADEAGRDPRRTQFMTQTTKGLLSWMHHLGPSNGKVMALMMLSSMEQDMTGAASQVREAKLPFLWYKSSSNVSEAIVWSARSMAPCDHTANYSTDLGTGLLLTSFCTDSLSTPAFQLLQFDNDAGTHCPWLNEDGSAEIFIDVVNGFLSRVSAGVSRQSLLELPQAQWTQLFE
jgi:hypothetical protein